MRVNKFKTITEEENDTGLNDLAMHHDKEKPFSLDSHRSKDVDGTKLISPYEIRYLTLSVNQSQTNLRDKHDKAVTKNVSNYIQKLLREKKDKIK